jgi:hypothetical protein
VLGAFLEHLLEQGTQTLALLDISFDFLFDLKLASVLRLFPNAF